MAGDWIKWQRGLARKPEVLRMCAKLGRSRHEIAGLLMEVWEWTDEQVADPDPDGHAIVRIESGQARAFIDHLTGLLGFADAMSAENWILFRSAHVVFPNWGRHNGKSAKRRALDAERKRSGRADGAEDVQKTSASKADKKRTRGEERREEVNTPPPPRTRSDWRELPLVKQHPELADAIGFWLAEYSRIVGGPQSDETRVELRLSQAVSAGWSVEKTIRSIEFSVLRNAKRWLDPDDDFDKRPRRGGDAKTAASAAIDRGAF